MLLLLLLLLSRQIGCHGGNPCENAFEFTRSVAFCHDTSRIREQMNGITAFIDGSNVYGSDVSVMLIIIRVCVY